MTDSAPPAPQPNGDDRFQELLARYADDALTDRELAEFAQLLRQDHGRTEALYETLYLASSIAEFEAASLQASEEPTAAVSRDWQNAGNYAPLTIRYWRAHPARFAALALSLTLLFWAGMGWLVISRFTGDGDNSPHSSSGVASITDIRNAAWAEGATTYKLEDSLAVGDSLDLAGGYLELSFADGAVVLLEAPVEFTINNRRAGTLTHGRLVARIEKKRGHPGTVPFAISTSLAQIIDLGTRFGVEAASDGSTQVEVFEGRVEATLLSNTRERIQLRQGESARIAASDASFQRQERSSTQFVQEVPDEDTQVITPVAVFASLDGTHPEACIDGSGLTTTGPIGAWTHTMEFVPTQTFWGTFVLELPVTLTFDLGAEYELSTAWFWNYSHPLESFHQRCAKTIGVAISSDGVHYTSLGQLVLPAFTEDPTMGHRYSFDHRARYVRFEILDSYMPAGARLEAAEVGLGEVRFEGTPVER